MPRSTFHRAPGLLPFASSARVQGVHVGHRSSTPTPCTCCSGKQVQGSQLWFASDFAPIRRRIFDGGDRQTSPPCNQGTAAGIPPARTTLLSACLAPTPLLVLPNLTHLLHPLNRGSLSPQKSSAIPGNWVAWLLLPRPPPHSWPRYPMRWEIWLPASPLLIPNLLPPKASTAEGACAEGDYDEGTRFSSFRPSSVANLSSWAYAKGVYRRRRLTRSPLSRRPLSQRLLSTLLLRRRLLTRSRVIE